MNDLSITGLILAGGRGARIGTGGCRRVRSGRRGSRSRPDGGSGGRRALVADWPADHPRRPGGSVDQGVGHRGGASPRGRGGRWRRRRSRGGGRADRGVGARLGRCPA